MVAAQEEAELSRRAVVAFAFFAVGRHAALRARSARRLATSIRQRTAVHDQHVDERGLAHPLDFRGRGHGQPGREFLQRF